MVENRVQHLPSRNLDRMVLLPSNVVILLPSLRSDDVAVVHARHCCQQRSSPRLSNPACPFLFLLISTLLDRHPGKFSHSINTNRLIAAMLHVESACNNTVHSHTCPARGCCLSHDRPGVHIRPHRSEAEAEGICSRGCETNV